jgi:hypothetical protein
MFALADAGFRISLETVKQSVGPKNLRILEVGWGQAAVSSQQTSQQIFPRTMFVMVWVPPEESNALSMANLMISRNMTISGVPASSHCQGISGRRLMDNADAAGRLQGV